MKSVLRLTFAATFCNYQSFFYHCKIRKITLRIIYSIQVNGSIQYDITDNTIWRFWVTVEKKLIFKITSRKIWFFRWFLYSINNERKLLFHVHEFTNNIIDLFCFRLLITRHCGGFIIFGKISVARSEISLHSKSQ